MNPDYEQTEKDLRAALRRTPAPKDFAAKVLAKACTTQRVVTMNPKGRPPAVTLALAAALAAAAIIPDVVLDYERRERAKGMEAKRELMTALAITRDQLRQAREKVRHAGRNGQ
jgi:hypothetical protein